MTLSFNLMHYPELLQHVETFLEVPYWKGQFTQHILPHLNKGWRLVGNGNCLE